jgi:hypothetical protein
MRVTGITTLHFVMARVRLLHKIFRTVWGLLRFYFTKSTSFFKVYWCVCLCIYIYIYIYIYTHTHIYIHTPRRRWEDNIKIDLQEVGYGGMD